MEEPEEIGKPLATTRTENRHEAFRARQLADCELVASLFERCHVLERSVLIGGVAFAGLNDDDGIQVVKHLRPPRRRRTAGRCQLAVAFGVLIEGCVVCSLQVGCRSPREAACPLLAGDLSEHVRQAAPSPFRRGRSNRDLDRARG